MAVQQQGNKGEKLDRRELLVRLGLMGTASAIGLGGAEVLARILAPVRPLMRFQHFDQALEGLPENQFRDLILDDPELFWRLAPGIRLPEDSRPFFGLISSNQGLREDHEISARKKEDEFRILCLGDSNTFGYRLSATETFVEQAEEMLRQRLPGLGINCINAGVPGYTLFQGWRFLVTQGAFLQPDLVLVNFGWNCQATWDGLSDIQHHRRWQKTRPWAGLRWSRLLQLLWASTQTGSESGSPARPRLQPQEFTTVLGWIEAEARSLGADLLLLVGAGIFNADGSVAPGTRTPYQMAQYRFTNRAALVPEGGTGLVDGVPIVQHLAKNHPVADLFFDRIHTTSLVHRALAHAIADQVVPWIDHRTSGQG